MATKTISARVNEDEAAWIEALAEMEGCDKSTFIKSVLRRGIRALRFERAVADYSKGEITLSRAAELAGLSTWDFLALMPQERLELHYGVDEFEEDLARFRNGSRLK
jgi:predicted HTH domain antitoxin